VEGSSTFFTTIYISLWQRGAFVTTSIEFHDVLGTGGLEKLWEHYLLIVPQYLDSCTLRITEEPFSLTCSSLEEEKGRKQENIYLPSF
jgi:hypothetical protein